jgi:hypothetical protein
MSYRGVYEKRAGQKGPERRVLFPSEYFQSLRVRCE